MKDYYNPNPKWFSRGCGLEYYWPRGCGWIPLGAYDGMFVPRPLVWVWRIWNRLKIKYYELRLKARRRAK